MQTLFGLVKLFVYHESAALVFGAITVLTLAALAFYHRARSIAAPRSTRSELSAAP